MICTPRAGECESIPSSGGIFLALLVMGFLAAISLLIVGLFTTLGTATFAMACGANAGPRAVTWLVRILVFVLVIGAVGLILSLFALMHARTDLALWLAAVPLAGSIVGFVALYRVG